MSVAGGADMNPSPWTTHPALSRTAFAAAVDAAVGLRVEGFEFWVTNLGPTSDPVSGFRSPVSGLRFPVSGFRSPVSGFRLTPPASRLPHSAFGLRHQQNLSRRRAAF